MKKEIFFNYLKANNIAQSHIAEMLNITPQAVGKWKHAKNGLIPSECAKYICKKYKELTYDSSLYSDKSIYAPGPKV